MERKTPDPGDVAQSGRVDFSRRREASDAEASEPPSIAVRNRQVFHSTVLATINIQMFLFLIDYDSVPFPTYLKCPVSLTPPPSRDPLVDNSAPCKYTVREYLFLSALRTVTGFFFNLQPRLEPGLSVLRTQCVSLGIIRKEAELY